MKPTRKNLKSWVPIVGLSALALSGLALFGQGAAIMVKAYVAQIMLADAFETAQATGEPQKAWGWADTRVMAKISVPRLEQQAIVLEGASGEAMAFGPAHLAQTPLPGQRGTAVIAAHRDTHFAFVKHIQPGDEIIVNTINGDPITFKAKGMRIVRWDNAGIDADAAGHFLALATCYPFDATTPGPLRYVVDAVRVQTDKDKV